jgi:hypothetical protein
VDGTGRPIERREEPVAGRVELAAAEAAELAADGRVMPLEQRTPARVAQQGCDPGRADDVGEEDRCEDALRPVAIGKP